MAPPVTTVWAASTASVLQVQILFNFYVSEITVQQASGPPSFDQIIFLYKIKKNVKLNGKFFSGKTGLLCHLDDACASNPCHAGASCETSPIDGTYLCSCPNGFKGVDCTEDIDECEAGSPCEHDGLCVNTPGSFKCNCTRGFTGPRCEININECDSNPCQNDGTCLDERGAFRCVCMPGTRLHRLICILI